MMIKILEEVAISRLKLNKMEYQIQLSSTLMNKAVMDVNKILPVDKQQKQDEMSNEFVYSFLNKEWIIINRAYRDDTNDSDVEEVLYNFAINNIKE